MAREWILACISRSDAPSLHFANHVPEEVGRLGDPIISVILKRSHAALAASEPRRMNGRSPVSDESPQRIVVKRRARRHVVPGRRIGAASLREGALFHA